MNAVTIAAWGGVISGVCALIIALANVVKDWVTGDEGRRAEAAAKRAESASTTAEVTATAHKTWFDDFEKAYDLIEERCGDCETKFAALDGRFHRLVDGLDDLCQSSETGVVSIVELRTVVRAARYET